MWWLTLFLMQDVQAQAVQTQAQRIRAAMAASLAQQRASVQQQVKSVVPLAAPVLMQVPLPPAADCEPIAQPELSKMIEHVATEHQVDPKLVLEVARQESGFRPCAISPKGAQGLMQLMPDTQMSLEVQNPFDPQENLTAGTKLLKQLLEHYNGDLSLALSAYNAGPTRVDKTAGVPQIPETMSYVTEILSRLKAPGASSESATDQRRSTPIEKP